MKCSNRKERRRFSSPGAMKIKDEQTNNETTVTELVEEEVGVDGRGESVGERESQGISASKKGRKEESILGK